MAAHPEYQGGVYLDPDPRTLKFMVHTYYAQSLSPLVISQAKDYNEVIKNAYDKWRYGSNYIVLTLFEEAIAKGRSIIYGTTSTGAHIPNFFAKLKKMTIKSCFFSAHALMISVMRRSNIAIILSVSINPLQRMQ